MIQSNKCVSINRSKTTSLSLAKLDNIVWQTLLFVSESLAMDKKVTPDLRGKQCCLASNVGTFRAYALCG